MAAPTITRPDQPLTVETILDASRSKAAQRAPSGWLAALRVGVGSVFLWAFLDKLLGLGYSTPSERAWLNGGSPTEGFLSRVDVGPFAGFFRDIAGNVVVDWLFMLGLLGIGVAVLSGVALRLAAAGGTLLMALMWAAEWHPARFTGAGEPTGSTNPLFDYHVVYALALIVLAVTYAGDRFGMGRRWAQLPVVRRYRSILR
ncbi:MAG: DoxX family protein [Microbacteriaceae bacterium]|jgi:thiosulfate dehydrogenase [quinone] large subunit